MSVHPSAEKSKVRVLFCDQLNIARGKYVPKKFAEDGEVRVCKGVYSLTYSREQVAAPGSGVDEGLPDVSLLFDPSDFRTSWHADTHIALADVCDGEKPAGTCGRSALKKAIDGWKKHGLEPMIGIEGEAYVFEEKDGELQPYQTPGSSVYGTGPFNDPENLMADIWEMSKQCGLPLESLNAEFDASQFELTLTYADALTACDDFFLFRNMAREVAFERGYLLSFMPKPIEDRGGSGMHINISFVDADGNNALATGTAPGNLSKLAQGCIAGLVNHHTALGAILAPTVNSYERLKPGSLCGYWANWGSDHRGAAVRVSGETGSAARIEHRVGDCAASPYFAVAAILQAALLGYENNYSLPAEEKEVDIDALSADSHIAHSLKESIELLRQDSRLTQAIGEEIIANYCAIKDMEIKELEGASQQKIFEYYSYFL